MTDWSDEVKTRLRNVANDVAGPDKGLVQLRADIRAALGRIRELEEELIEAREKE